MELEAQIYSDGDPLVLLQDSSWGNAKMLHVIEEERVIKTRARQASGRRAHRKIV